MIHQGSSNRKLANSIETPLKHRIKINENYFTKKISTNQRKEGMIPLEKNVSREMFSEGAKIPWYSYDLSNLLLLSMHKLISSCLLHKTRVKKFLVRPPINMPRSQRSLPSALTMKLRHGRGCKLSVQRPSAQRSGTTFLTLWGGVGNLSLVMGPLVQICKKEA